MKKWLSLLVLLAGAAGAQKNNKDVLNVVTGTTWGGLDAAYCYGTACAWAYGNITETLLRQNPKDPTRLDLLLAAQMPSVANGGISKDGKTYTIKLRKGLKFSDGTPLTASDVEYSIKRMMVYGAEEGPSILLTEPLLGEAELVTKKTDWARIDASVNATAADTVVFRLAKPFAPFLGILAFPNFGVISKAAAIKAGDWSGTQKDWQNFVGYAQAKSYMVKAGPVGSGPFVLERYEPDKLTVYKRNENYWRTKANFQRVIVQVVPDETTRLQLLKTGDADMADQGSISAAMLPGLQSQGLNVIKTPALGISGFFFNVNINPQSRYLGSKKLDGQGIPVNFFNDRNVRLGFAYAFDYQTYLRDVLLGQGTQQNTLNVAGLLGQSTTSPKYSYDPAKAATYFKKAFGGQVWEKGFTVSVIVKADSPAALRVVDVLKRGIESINPKFKVQAAELSRAERNQVLFDRSAPMQFNGWGVDYADPHNMFQPLVGGSSFFNSQTGYANPAVDRLIDQGIAETAPAKRAALYQKLGRLVWEDAALLPLYQGQNVKVQQNWVKGRPLGDEFFYGMSK